MGNVPIVPIQAQAGLDAMAAPQTLDQQNLQVPTQAVGSQSEQIPPYKPYVPPAPTGPAPGSFGAKLASALKGFTAAMGDAGSVGQVPQGAGWLYGATKTAQAAAQRQKEEQAHQEAQQQQARENTREDWRMMANVATSNATMRHTQALISQLGDQAQDRAIAADSKMNDQWDDLPKSQSIKKAEDVTAAEINALIRKNQADPEHKSGLDPTTTTAFHTGKRYAGEDANGNPQYTPTYTVRTLPAEYQLTKDDQPWVDVANQIPGGPKLSIKYDQDGNNQSDRMSGYAANSLYKQVQTIQAQTAARNQAAAGQEFENEYVNFDTSGQWTKYLAAQKGDVSQAMTHFLADWQKDPKLQVQFPNLQKDIVRSFATKDDPSGNTGFTSALDKQQKDREAAARDTERVRHDQEMERITEQNKKLEEATKNKYEGDPDLLERYEATTDPTEKIAAKQAYRNSFPANEMSVIDNVGKGKAGPVQMAYLMRSPTGSNLADAVNFFYPDFDTSKVQGYADAVKSADAGKDNVRLRSAGIASKHLWQLYQDTTEASRLPGSEAQKQRTATFNQLATELAAFNAQSNAPGQKEIEDAKSTLGGDAWYSMNRQAAFKRAASLMQDGLSEYKQRWKNAAPSSAYESKFPDMSPESYAALQLVQNDGKVTIKDSQGRPYTFTDVGKLSQYLQAKMALEKQQGAQ